MAKGDDTIEIIDWDDLFARNDGDESIITGLAFRGRWTAIASTAKAGKSTVLLGLAVGVGRAGLSVLYLDAEMGRADVLDRVEEWMQLKPDDLANVHYSDLPPKLDTIVGSSSLGRTVSSLRPDLVIIDGLNGVVNGAENDDTTWRDLYEWAIAPMKLLNIAVLSADNLGKDRMMGPRGSSVKLDKADAIIELERTDQGCKLTATHRRTASYPVEQHYVVANASEEGPPMTVIAVNGSLPDGTSGVVAVLEQLGVPVDIGIREARRMVRAHGHAARNETIDAAVRVRRKGVPTPSGTLFKPPGSGPCPEGVSSIDTPPSAGTLPPDLEEQF